MTDLKMRYGIYPKLPENADEWRLQSCINFEEEIKKDVTKYSTNRDKMEKKLKKLKNASKIILGVGGAAAISGAALSATIVITPISIPLFVVGIICSTFSVIPAKIYNNVIKEIIKNEKLIVLIDAKLSRMRGIINKSLKDKKIDEEEYKYVEYEYNEYKQMKVEMLKSPKVLKKESQNISVKELAEKLDELLKK